MRSLEITGADQSMSKVAAHIGRVKKSLNEANPPYTPQDVLDLPRVAATQMTWTAGRVLTLGEVEKYIGLTRSNGKPVEAKPGSKRAETKAEYETRTFMALFPETK